MSVTATFVSVPAALLTTLHEHPLLARALGDEDRLLDVMEDLDLDEPMVQSLHECAQAPALELDAGWDAARRVLHAARRLWRNPANAFDIGRHVAAQNVSLLAPADVQRVARALASTPPERLRTRAGRARVDVDPPYPFDAGTPDAEIVEYALEAISRLRAFFNTAAKAGDGVVRWIE